MCMTSIPAKITVCLIESEYQEGMHEIRVQLHLEVSSWPEHRVDQAQEFRRPNHAFGKYLMRGHSA